jgi:two-component system OmpR family response regulator
MRFQMNSLPSPTVQKVLVAEDDPDIRKVIRMSLRHGGVNDVVLTGDGRECLAAVNRVRPDLILLDVSMPHLDGYQTCVLLKANPETKSIPVIFLTAKVQAQEAEIGMKSGALGYLSKPFDPLTLHEQILALLAKGAARGNP